MEVGCRTGFLKRRRQITPPRLALALLSTLGTQKTKTLADVLRAFNALSGCSVQYKPFHNQLSKRAFPVFMREVFRKALTGLVLRVLRPMELSKLNRFKDIVIHDGTSFALHVGLRHAFPGRFTKIKPAAVELHTTMSVFRDQVSGVQVAPDVCGEREFLPPPEWLGDKLLLADRGYAELRYCVRVQQAGGSFLFRFKRDTNPRVTAAWVGDQPVRTWAGRRFQDVLGRLRGQSADLDVQWRRGSESIRMRLVVLRRLQAKGYVLLATNLPRQDFAPSSVASLYRLRWQIELVFKDWKSYANLHRFATRKPGIAEGLIWAALTAALLKRFLSHAAEAVYSSVELSTHRAALALGYHLPRLMQALLKRTRIRTRTRELLQFLLHNGQRAHRSKDRVSGRLSVGLRHRWPEPQPVLRTNL
jgi:hypothetical protein